MSPTARTTGLHARTRRVSLVLVAVLVTLLLWATPPPALAETDSDADTPLPPSLVLTPTNSGLTDGEGPARAMVTLRNPSATALPSGRVTLELGRTPLTDAGALAAWLGAGESDAALTTVATELAPQVLPGRDAVVDIFTPDLGLTTGVYPLRARLGTATEARSVLIVAAAPRPIAILVPVTLRPADGVLLSADELAAATAPDGTLTTVLDAVSGTTAALAVDPAIPAAIRVLGTAAPASALQWLTQLEAMPNTRFGLRFGDADLAVQAQAELTEPLDTSGLSVFLESANFSAPTDAALPDTDELTGIRNALPGLVWPRGGVSPTDLEAFAGYVGDAATTVLPSSAATASAPLAQVDGHRVLRYEAPASAAVSRAIDESDAAVRGSALTTALAHLTIGGSTGPVLVALDRDDTRTVDGLREAVDALRMIGTPLRLDELLAADTPPATIRTVGAPARAEAVPALLADEAKLTAFATALDEPAQLTQRERIRLLRLLSVGEPPDGFGTALAAHRTRTTATISAVAIEPTSDVQILSATVDLPVWVRNDLPWPVTVHLAAQSRDPRLEVQSETIVTAPAETNTRVRVPVKARVASGEVDVRLRLTSAEGVLISGPESTRVIVRAEWESIGLSVLGVLVALLFVVGTVRTVRHRRRGSDAASDRSGS